MSDSVTSFIPLIVLLIVVGVDVWVYVDAKARQDGPDEVVMTFGSFSVDTPTAWLVGCLLLFVVFFPLYLVARRASR